MTREGFLPPEHPVAGSETVLRGKFALPERHRILVAPIRHGMGLQADIDGMNGLEDAMPGQGAMTIVIGNDMGLATDDPGGNAPLPDLGRMTRPERRALLSARETPRGWRAQAVPPPRKAGKQGRPASTSKGE